MPKDVGQQLQISASRRPGSQAQHSKNEGDTYPDRPAIAGFGFFAWNADLVRMNDVKL